MTLHCAIQDSQFWDLPSKNLPSNAEDSGSTPGLETNIPYATATEPESLNEEPIQQRPSAAKKKKKAKVLGQSGGLTEIRSCTYILAVCRAAREKNLWEYRS